MYVFIALTVLYSYAPPNGSSTWDCVYLIYFFVPGVRRTPGAEQESNKCRANECTNVCDCSLGGQGHRQVWEIAELRSPRLYSANPSQGTSYFGLRPHVLARATLGWFLCLPPWKGKPHSSPPPPHPRLRICKVKIHFQWEISI